MIMSKSRFKNICWSCLVFVCAGVAIVLMAGSSCKTKTDMRELIDIPVMEGDDIETTHQPKIILTVIPSDVTFQCKSQQIGFKQKFQLILM